MTTDLTVLVVDDDFMVAGIHTRFVQRHGRLHGGGGRGDGRGRAG